MAWGAWRKSLNRFHYIECNVDYMQRTYGKASEDMGIDFELVPLYRHPVPLSPDHSGGGAGMVLPASNDWIRSAARKWFYESFDDELLQKMQDAKLIAQAEGFSISVMAELELAMEEAYCDKVKELNP